MDLKFIRNRISVLRTKKNVSEYRMSTDLGHSKSYIQSISSGRSMPSLTEFLYICEYLGVTPKEFFDEDVQEPQLVKKLYNITRNMSDEDLTVLISTAERLNKR
ncbi:MAG: helix-turn-helix transcriptional regulator [Acutalibacteraceae bacterium]|nr:helix-turn-helix transcriptional regulator [Acutalibacteraceae bacterium]